LNYNPIFATFLIVTSSSGLCQAPLGKFFLREWGSGKWEVGSGERGEGSGERGETIHNWVVKVGLGVNRTIDQKRICYTSNGQNVSFCRSSRLCMIISADHS